MEKAERGKQVYSYYYLHFLVIKTYCFTITRNIFLSYNNSIYFPKQIASLSNQPFQLLQPFQPLKLYN